MIALEDARERILAAFRRLEPEDVPILDGLGRILAEEVFAEEDIPPFDNSAMDGFAVRASDTRGTTREAPATLPVIGEIAAGTPPSVEVRSGTAVRIMTGAPLPPGADAVVRLEDSSEARGRLEESVEIYVEVPPRHYVRDAGEDLARGGLAIPEGRMLRPQEIGVLASLGRSRVRVTRQPRVAVLATGDELVDVEEPLGPGQIRNSNEYATSAHVVRYGGVPLRLGIARDTVDDLKARIQEGLEQGADLLVSSAGVSVGAHDLVKEVLAGQGTVEFWQVAMRPGKPLAFGRIGETPVVGLPGNPVSAMVSFEQFVRPAILRMRGVAALDKPTVEAEAEEELPGGDRMTFWRGIVTRQDGTYFAKLAGSHQGSGVLSSMARANALLVVPAGSPGIAAGSAVTAQMLDWPEGMVV
ncbi:MAG: gephyrin-like molybdotransferase Glp [Anaerolineae bacterium]